MEHSKECPPDLVSTISDLIYACQRVDIPELTAIRKQFRAKYGKKFEEAALTNTGGVINERIVSKLSVHPPAAYLVQTYLEKICSLHEVDWTPTIRLSAEQAIEPMAAPVGFSVLPGQGELTTIKYCIGCHLISLTLHFYTSFLVSNSLKRNWSGS